MALGSLNSEADLLNWLRRQFPALAGVNNLSTLSGINFGVATLTWAGGVNFSGATTVTHGMGSTPAAVALGAVGASGVGSPHAFITTSPDAASFAVSAWNSGGAPIAGSTAPFYWIAVV